MEECFSLPPLSMIPLVENFLDLTIDFSVSADLLNGAQEKCELPSLEGFPHCEGKLKVNGIHADTYRDGSFQHLLLLFWFMLETHCKLT